nr:flagellar hook-length control protein FliK [uncultured Cupriavidus sp.]
MIDISQLVGNAAALNNLKSPDASSSKGADANLFHDVLSRAREDNQQGAPAAASQVKVPPKDNGKQADASKDTAAQKPQQPAANNALPQKDSAKVAAKTDSGDSDTKDCPDDDTASSDAAAVAAALAAAALLPQLPVNPQQANAANAVNTAGVDPLNGGAIAGLPTLPTQAAASAAATTAASTTTDDAAALQAQVDAQLPAATVATAAKGTTPSPTDTLALIAQQRAALQNNTPTTADKIAAAVTTPAQAAAQDTRGQGSAGQQHANLGQSNQPALTQTDNTQAAQTAQPVTPFAAAQASARTGEAVDTGATNSSSAATLASAMAAQAPIHTAQATAAAAAARPVIAPNVNDSQWSQALGQQMVRMSTQGNQTAELDLNPPNLGPLKVVLNVVNDQAQAQFVSPHQAVRAAVEAALPHLRTSMAEAGIQLGQTSVGADSFAQAGNGGQQQQQRQASNGNSFGQSTGFGNDTAAPAAPATPRAPRTLARGEVDTFA